MICVFNDITCLPWQESLGGNSLCTMLATLSPAACNFEETGCEVYIIIIIISLSLSLYIYIYIYI